MTWYNPAIKRRLDADGGSVGTSQGHIFSITGMVSVIL